MSILIKGMEMPTSCPCELLGIGYDLSCSFAGGIPARVKEYYECCQNGTRPSWCPLIPVPPHGRLIDVDALKASIHCSDTDEKKILSTRELHCVLNGWIDGRQTIIEAEEGEA